MLSECTRVSSRANLRILFGSVEHEGVFRCVRRSDRGLFSKSVSLPLKRANQRLTSVDGSGVPSQCAADVLNGCCRSRAMTPFTEYDDPKVALWI